jgi:hypothetical protein
MEGVIRLTVERGGTATREMNGTTDTGKLKTFDKSGK